MVARLGRNKEEHLVSSRDSRSGAKAVKKDVCSTCRQRREWARPQLDDKAQPEVPQEINAIVEAAIPSYKDGMVLHVIDRASRHHNGCEAATTTRKDL